MKKKVLVLLLCLALVVSMFAGCAKDNDDVQNGSEQSPTNGDTNNQPEEKSKFGGTLTIGTYADPDTLNPLTGNDMAGSWILNLVYPTLMVMDSEGNKVPYIIEEPIFSEDGKQVTVKLIDGLVWQDGTPMTSEDIAYTYKVLYEQKLMWQWSMLEGITWDCPDEKTIVFTLEKPYPSFITSLGFWQRIVPKHIWEGIEDIKTFTNENPVGLGPFKLTEYERGQYYVLESVENWPLAPEGRPYLDKVIYKPYPDVNTMVLALKAGDIDLTAKEIPHAAYEELSKDPNFTVAQNMSLGYEHMSFNCTDEILQDVNIRTAIAMGIDRQQVIDFTFDGDAVPMPGIISPVYEKYQIDINFPEYDLEGAKQLLADSGYIDTDNDGILNAPNGENCSFEVIFATTYTEHEKMARVLAEQFKKLGLDLQLKPLDKSLQSEKLYKTHEYQLTIGTWGIIDDVESSMLTLFHSSTVLNWMLWKNEKGDEAMENMKRAITEEEVMNNMEVFQKEFTTDIPDIPVVVKKCNFAYNKKFDGFIMKPSNLKGLVNPESLVNVYIVE